MLALIPARAGSQRVKNKNLTLLGDKPLIVWSIQAAIESDVFDQIIVSTDSPSIGEVAYEAGACVIERPAELATATSPDIEWLRHLFGFVHDETFSVLRPTSPFRTAETIRRAKKIFDASDCDSIRAVRKVRERVEKMWVQMDSKGAIFPLEAIAGSRYTDEDYRDASRPYQALEADYGKIWVQDSSLEMAHTQVVLDTGLLSGTKVAPFFTEGYEGFTIDYEEDLLFAQMLIEKGLVKL